MPVRIVAMTTFRDFVLVACEDGTIWRGEWDDRHQLLTWRREWMVPAS